MFICITLFLSAILYLGDRLWIIRADRRCRHWEHDDRGLRDSYLYGYDTFISHTDDHRDKGLSLNDWSSSMPLY